MRVGTPVGHTGYEPVAPPARRPEYRRRSVVTKLQPTLEIRLDGQASKRGLIPRTPGGERLLRDVAAWLTAEYPDQVRSAREHMLPSGDAELDVGLHPATPAMILTAGDSGGLQVRAETVQGGPGYHRWARRPGHRLGPRR